MSVSEKFHEFVIVLDNATGTFYPGQQVTGHVKIHTKKNIKTTGIYVRFLGSCYGSSSKSCVQAHNKPTNYKQHYDSIVKHENRDNWVAQSSYLYQASDSEQRKFYKDTEVYFDAREKLWGTDKVEKFSAGSFNLAFQFNLPNNLPTSYEGDRGYVRYVVMANVARSWNSHYRTMLPFTVISVVDLNNIPGVERPVSKHEVRKFGFLIFKAGSVTTKISINKKGFVPGETIILNGDIYNGSMSRISKTLTRLVSVTTYRVDGNVFQSKQDLVQVEGVSIPSKSSWELKNIHLNIPPAPPSGLGGCGPITVDYNVQVTSITEMGSVDVVLPIIIGTIPLRTDFASMHAAPLRPARQAPPRPPPLNLPVAAAISPEMQEAATRRLAKEEEALGIYHGATGPGFSEERPSAPTRVEDLLTGTVAVVDVSEDNAAPLIDINQISSRAISEMYPDLPPPSYEECVYGGRVNVSDNEDDERPVEIEQIDGAGAKPESSNHFLRASSSRENQQNSKHQRNTFAPSYVYYHQDNMAT